MLYTERIVTSKTLLYIIYYKEKFSWGDDYSYMIRVIRNKLMEEIIFTISFILAVVTSFLSPPRLDYIDWKVLISLFNLMLIILAFEKLQILEYISIHILSQYKSARKVSFFLVVLTFFSSMLITNDVALITFVPITLIIARKSGFDPMLIVILQTLAANIGSGLTPMGNPQNLFLFSFYGISLLDFIKTMLPFALVGLLWLLLLNLKIPEKSLEFSFDSVSIRSAPKLIVYVILFCIVILSIFDLLSYSIIFVIITLIVLMMDKDLLRKIDYFLLATFVCFFIFIGNLSNLQSITHFIQVLLNTAGKSYFTTILLSQMISNVPCAILVASFTEFWQSVLLGVNIGGMGTLIASLASVISYKFYAKYYDGKNYLRSFHMYSFISLLLFTVLLYLIL